MILVDTTVLVYAVGTEHPLRDPCRDFVRLVGEGVVAATTTVEVVQEFVHVRARLRGRADAADRARELIALFAPLVRPDHHDLERGLALFAADERLGAFDAVLAAVAIRDERIRAIASADRVFDDVPGVELLDPAAQAFLERVRA